jgi:hypothetical protein
MYYRRKILLSLLEVFGNELEKIRLLFVPGQCGYAYDDQIQAGVLAK